MATRSGAAGRAKVRHRESKHFKRWQRSIIARLMTLFGRSTAVRPPARAGAGGGQEGWFDWI